jgi:hypothetical protein
MGSKKRLPPNGRRVGIRIVTFEACSGFLNRLHKLEAHSQRKQKPITKQLSYKVLRPITAYASQRHAIV